MRRIFVIIMCAVVVLNIANAQSKIKYTISNGLRIEGVDHTNNIIYDNDMIEDTPEDEYLWLRYHHGQANLVGNIITRNMDMCNQGACKVSMQATIDQWNRVSSACKAAGLKIVEPTIGADQMITTPGSRKIEDTPWRSSAGADLIIREALKCTKEKPLVIVVGGQVTTVANAYLKNPAIADRIIVFHVHGYIDKPTTVRSFNTIDAWSAYIVMKKMRYVNFAGDSFTWYKGKDVNLTQAMVNGLPDSHMGKSIKHWYANLFRHESMADAPPVLYLYNPSLWRNVERRLENGQITTSDTFDYLMVSQNDWTNYGPSLVNYIKNPGTPPRSENKLPVIQLTSPAVNAKFVAGAAITISANASDTDGSITKVEFYNGSTKLGEDATSPYSFVWNNAPVGTHSVTAKATDNQSGSSTSSAVSLTVASANTAPSVNITSPSNNATFTAGATISITANATDANGSISKVEFFNGATKLGEDNTQPYSFSWNSVTAGSHVITTKATDNEGAVKTSSSVTIVVSAPANISPTVSLTSPANNVTMPHGSTIVINANAEDSDGSIAKVEFFQGTTKLGEDVTSPFSFSWSGVAAGNYSISAKATDNKGAVTLSSAIAITISAPVNVRPTVTITNPANNTTATAGAAITIQATAADADGNVAKVEFFNGSTKLGEDLVSPYSFIWQNAPAGTHQLTAKATDNKGAVTTSVSVALTINNIPNVVPTINITNPANNLSVTAGSTITINATATDSDGTISKVEFYQGNTKLGEDLTSPYSFSWRNVAAGEHSLTAKATDNKGAIVTSSPITITAKIANTPPVVAITSPANGETFSGEAAITISANATDANGTITKVEFYRGVTKLGEDLTSPYSYNWTNAPQGNHSITAKAIDNQNVTATSTAVLISVEVPESLTTVSITSPAHEATFTPGSSVAISAATNVTHGHIIKVEFFNGNQKLGEALSAPYNLAWNNVTEGTYNITAKATNDRNELITSQHVTIFVKNTNTIVGPAWTNPIANAGEDTTLSLPANSVILSGTAITSDGQIQSQSWQQLSGPAEVLPTDATENEVILTQLVAGTYVFEFTVTDTKGLISKDQVKIEIANAAISENVIPRYFTPNDDGINDVWEFSEHELLENAHITIFNRSGQKIYEAYAYQSAWDGKLEGKPLEEDAYYYVIRLSDNNDIKGAVRIIR